MKNWVYLSGGKELEPWVQKSNYESGIGDLFLNAAESFSQSVWPLVQDFRIPKPWLARNPGFPILCRQAVPSSKKRVWIKSPAEYAFIQTRRPRALKKVLVILHHLDSNTALPTWRELQSRYPKSDVRWCGYALRKPHPYPSRKMLEFRFLLSQTEWIPDLIDDVTYWRGDTISPLHLHCVQNGAVIKQAIRRSLPRSAVETRSLYYGNWVITAGAGVAKKV